MSSLYFAYGSNLSRSELARAAPSARPVAKALLPNYRLTFDKHSMSRGGDAANIVKAPGAAVWGFVYEVDDEDLISLRSKESGYKEHDVVATLMPKGHRQEAVVKTFIASSSCTAKCGPRRAYLETVISGAERCGFPNEYVDRLRAIRTVEDDVAK